MCGGCVRFWLTRGGHIGPSRAVFEFFVALQCAHPTIAMSAHNAHTTRKKFNSGGTHARELDAAVTALGSGTLLLQVQVPELTTRGLDDANLVGPRVVPVEREKRTVNKSFKNGW